MILALLCIATCQQLESERVRPIVERLMGPRIKRGLPLEFIAQRSLMGEIREPAARVVPVGDLDVEAEVPVAAKGRMVLSKECFEFWVFGNVKGMERAWMDSLLRDRLLTQAVRYQLTEAEIAKLHLAGKGDIKRLFDEIEVRRGAYDRARFDINKGRIALSDTFGISRRVEHGPFYEGSISDKVLTKILEDRKR